VVSVLFVGRGQQPTNKTDTTILASVYFPDHCRNLLTGSAIHIYSRVVLAVSGQTVFFLPIILVEFSPKSSPEARRGLLSLNLFESRRWVPSKRKYPFDIGALLSHFTRRGLSAVDQDPSGDWSTGRS